MELAKKWSLAVSYLNSVSVAFDNDHRDSGLGPLWRILRDIRTEWLMDDPLVVEQAIAQLDQWTASHGLAEKPCILHPLHECETLIDGILEAVAVDPDLKAS